jgi:hypothetical protein
LPAVTGGGIQFNSDASTGAAHVKMRQDSGRQSPFLAKKEAIVGVLCGVRLRGSEASQKDPGARIFWSVFAWVSVFVSD